MSRRIEGCARFEIAAAPGGEIQPNTPAARLPCARSITSLARPLLLSKSRSVSCLAPAKLELVPDDELKCRDQTSRLISTSWIAASEPDYYRRNYAVVGSRGR